MQSDTLDNRIAALEQNIRDVETDISKAETEAEKAKAEGNTEELKYWRVKEQQLRVEKQQLRDEKQQLRDEKARKENLQQGVATAAVPMLNAYFRRIANLPAPSIFGKYWTAYQYADSMGAGQAPFESTDPLLNVYRPATAQGLPAAFAHEAFGSFLDAKYSAPITTSAAKTVFRLVNIMSHTYLPTNTNACKAAVAKSLGPDYKGKPRGQEGQLMAAVRKALLEYLRVAIS